MPNLEGELFILTLRKMGGLGKEVSILLDEAVSDQPDFLVAAVRGMKVALDKMPDRKPDLNPYGFVPPSLVEEQVTQAINPDATREPVPEHSQFVKDKLRAIRDTPQA